jgi:hypothetical protein
MEISSPSSVEKYQLNMLPTLLPVNRIDILSLMQCYYLSWVEIEKVFRGYYKKDGLQSKKQVNAFVLSESSTLTQEEVMSVYKEKLKEKILTATESKQWSPSNSYYKKLDAAKQCYLYRSRLPADKPLSLRRKKYIGKPLSLIFDFDCGVLTTFVETSVALLRALKITFIAHSSFSASDDNNKFRVIIPYAVPVKYGHEKCWEFFAYLFDKTYSIISSGCLDITSSQPYRGFYMPNRNSDVIYNDNEVHSIPHWYVSESTGSFLDPVKTSSIFDYLREKLPIKTIKEMVGLCPKLHAKTPIQ